MTSQIQQLPPSLEHWGQQFLDRTAEHPVTRRFRVAHGFAAGLAAMALAVGVAAAADLGPFDFDPQTSDLPTLGDGGTIAYMDLSTNEPIRCPDGRLLTLNLSDGLHGPPECSDGSTPQVYTDQERAFDEWMHKQPFGTPLRDGPNFAFQLRDGRP